MARDAIARQYDVDKNRVLLDLANGTITFHARKGRSLDVAKMYESFQATSLEGPNGIEVVRYLEITALGEVVAGKKNPSLKVPGGRWSYELGNDPDLKPVDGKPTVWQRLREALAKGVTVTGVTGRVHAWSIPFSSKDPEQLTGKKPLLLIVTDFQTAWQEPAKTDRN